MVCQISVLLKFLDKSVHGCKCVNKKSFCYPSMLVSCALSCWKPPPPIFSDLPLVAVQIKFWFYFLKFEICEILLPNTVTIEMKGLLFELIEALRLKTSTVLQCQLPTLLFL